MKTGFKYYFQNLLFKIPLLLCLGIYSFTLQAQSPLKVALAGLGHDHVNLIMQSYTKGDVQIIGIAEADQQLVSCHSFYDV